MDPRNSLVDQYVWDVKPVVRRNLRAYGVAQVKLLGVVQACGSAVAANLAISACERRRVKCGPTQ